MDYQISIGEGNDHIVLKVFKPMTSDIGRLSAPEMIRLAERHNIHKYVIDVRSAPNLQSVAKNYSFAYKELPELAFPRSSITAFLISAGDPSHEFIELAFKNAGYQVKSFTSPEEALSWLRQKG